MTYVCPRCESRDVRKYGKLTTGKGKYQRFRCESCGHVWQEPMISSVPEDCIELVLTLLKVFIADVETGKALNDAGWLPVNDNMLRKLKSLDFCEIDNKNKVARIKPTLNLPADLSLTTEGAIFFDYIKALRIIDLVQKIRKDQNKYKKAIAEGLIRMFKNARYTFWENRDAGEIPAEVRDVILTPNRMEIMRSTAKILAAELLSSVWGEEESLIVSGDLNTRLIEKVKKVLMWDDLVRFFCNNSDLIEDLGFLWYIDKIIVDYNIEYLGAIVFIYEQVFSRQEYEKLEVLGEELENFIGVKEWGVCWDEIFCIPL